MSTKQIPKAAAQLRVGEVSLRSNGEGAKTAPVSLLARTGDAIEHWFWGKVVHDLSGMKPVKSRLPIDWNHTDEVIGVLSKFDTDTGDLVATGHLKANSARTPDHAAIVMNDMQGEEPLPYEASINFGGDGIVIEEIPQGVGVQVNGRQFTGPITVIREWPLRGVAITPYGADQNTQTSMNNESAVTVTVRHSQPEVSMSDSNPAEVAQTEATVEAPKANETEPKAEETAPAAVVDSTPAEAAVLAQPATVEAKPHDRYVKLAGDKGATAFLAGTEWDAFVFAVNADKDKTIEALTKEVAELKAKLAAVPTGNPPASFSVADAKPKPDPKLVHATGSEGLAAFASNLKFNNSK